MYKFVAPVVQNRRQEILQGRTVESCGKLLFSSLVMLSTMEDRRRRLEEAVDSPAPESRRKPRLIPPDSSWLHVSR